MDSSGGSFSSVHSHASRESPIGVHFILQDQTIHSNLKALTCTDERLIRYLTLPKLEKLHLQSLFLKKFPPDMILQSQELLMQSVRVSNLRALRLDDALLGHDVFVLLKMTTELVELSFTFVKWETAIDSFMKELVQRMSNYSLQKERQKKPIPLRKLESAKFKVDIEPIRLLYGWFKCMIRWVDKTFVNMVEGRWRRDRNSNRVSRIRVVEFEGTRLRF
ncbi:hypothetical protein D9757_014862 [Collybiopsis confluens]|uniref:Uncharacterized protein n=1 Tax=Collybiopsis confluens TaxID=2823264 RepID=A0A8H5FTI0_9AGAR|nr:hypothetical protein D9757_014862 [Collybiopsis confluens]